MTMKFARRLHRHCRKDEGSSMVELALVMPTLMLVLLAAIDFSRAYYLAIEVSGAAHAGAEYGSQNVTDITGIKAAATSDAPDVPGLTVSTPTYGCECSDGTKSSTSCTTEPSCTYNVVYWVKVSASATYTPVFPWPGIPASINIAQTATMRSGS